MVFEDEIPKELELGKIYSSKQIKNFIYDNSDILVCSDDATVISDRVDTKYRVVAKHEKYIYQLIDGSYCIPNIKQRIYFVIQE